MYSPLLSNILLLLSLLFASAVAAVPQPGAVLVERQQPAMPVLPNPAMLCYDYSQTANLSTIGSNSSYRSAFLQASPAGTRGNSNMLDAFVKKLPALTKDINLNRMCGNLTTIAKIEAERNYTMGVVAQFSGLSGKPSPIKADTELIILMFVILMGFMGVTMFMP